MAYVSPLLTNMVSIVKKVAINLNRDFSEIERLQTSIKGSLDFTRIAFDKAQKAIVSEFSKFGEAYPVVLAGQNAQNKNSYFSVSVIDGIANFAHGNPDFAISVGLIDNGMVIDAVVYNPARDELFFAEKGKGAFREGFTDDSAIVEYYFVLGEESLGKINRGNNHLFELDVFVTSKTQGKICFNHLRIPAGDSVLDITNSFVEILQDPDDLSKAGEKDALRSKLYDTLLVPVMPYLSDVSTLYIAPDDQLCNLPFEILYNNESGLLQDRFTICRLVCGRDILFYDDQQESNGGCFILGGPNYEAEKGETSKAKERGVESSLVPVDALPFSGLEARRVARRCRVEPFIGNDATKFALQEALPCRIIHIATHGVFDEETEIDALYSAQLVFAGYNKWVSHKTESSGCGNGILTADEISRMDLHKTDLVVLSACQTGLGDTSYRSTRGLISAFSAAGARWIICHMWEASDFATPILMDAFYYAHLNLCMEVPEALQYAKNYLRGVTVGDLLREGWLDIPNDLDLPIESQEEILALRNANMRRRPFEDEFYWGGFTVHKSR